MATGLFGLDEAWARTPIADLKAHGVHFMARYLSPDPTKNITASEVRDYHANGIAVVVVWEGAGTAMLGGYARGVADAKEAEIQRKAVGLPSDMPIYFACDFDAQGSQYHAVNEYMRGVNSVIGLSRSGFYGGKYTCDNVAAAPARASFFWQTIAWSNGRKANKVNIYQDAHTLFGGVADTDYAETADYGQYPRPNGEDMPLTDADAELVAKHVANFPIPNQFNKGVPTPLGTFLQYGDKHYLDIMGELASVKAENEQIKAALTKVGTPTLTEAQVTALAAQVAPVLEKLLVPAFLAAIGHALDGTPAPTAPAGA